ncbi:MAG: hypothetical protein ACXAC7_14685 [Candidatus Hodarchaeales archaeon]|jgi:hypothetical protein
MNEIVVGQEYAKLVGIIIGDHIILNSRPHPIVLEVVVVGIFKTQSIADEGLLGPLWMGRLFAGMVSDYVNIIRIKFDPTIHEINSLSEIILKEHILSVYIYDRLNAGLDLSKTKIILYSRIKEKINTSTVGTDQSAIFSLPFGKYFIQGNHPNISYSPFIPIYITNQTQLQLGLGQNLFSLNLNITISKVPANNASITVMNIESNELWDHQTDENGHFDKFIPEGMTKITIFWKEYINSTTFQVNDHISMELDFSFTPIIEVINTTSKLPLSNIMLSWRKNNSQVVESGLTNVNGRLLPIMIPKIPYQLNISSENFQSVYNISYFNTSVFTIYFGNTLVSVEIVDSELKPLAFQLVNISGSIKNFSIISNVTGWISFYAPIDSIIILRSINAETNLLFSLRERITLSIEIRFYLGSQEFFIKYKYLSEINSENNIHVSVEDTETGLKFINKINNSGYARFILPYGSYSIKMWNQSYSIDYPFIFQNSLNNEIELHFDNISTIINLVYHNGSAYNGSYTLEYNLNSDWISLLNANESILKTNLQLGVYRLLSTDPNYILDLIFQTNITGQTNLTISVIEKLPNIAVDGVKNGEKIPTLTPLKLMVYRSDLSLYNWNEGSNQTFTNNETILAPEIEGFQYLNLYANNSENKWTSFQITIVTIKSNIRVSLTNAGNNSFVPLNFTPSLSFSEIPKNVTFQWDSGQNSTNITTIPSIEGYHVLKVLMEDNQNNTEFYLFLFFLDLNPPNYEITGFHRGNIVFSSSTLYVTVIDNMNQSGLIYYKWNESVIETKSTSVIQVPTKVGLHLLNLSIRDLAGNWFNTSLEIVVQFSLEIWPINLENSSVINNVTIILASNSSEMKINSSNFGNFITPVEFSNYTIILKNNDYNITQTINIFENTLLFIELQPYEVKIYKQTIDNLVSGFIQWNSSSWTSSFLFINGSRIIFSEPSNMIIKVLSGDDIYFREIDEENSGKIRLPIGNITLHIKVTSSNKYYPIEGADIKIEGYQTNITNKDGMSSIICSPGILDINISYSTINYATQIFLEQSIIYVIPLNINSSVIIRVEDNLGLTLQNVRLDIYDSANIIIDSSLTNWYGEYNTSSLPWGKYRLKVSSNGKDYNKFFTINTLTPNPIEITVFSRINDYFSEIGINPSKWSQNRNYQISDPSILSANTLDSLGFTLALTALFLIITMMTIIGLIATTYHPLYILQEPIKILRLLGVMSKQIKISISLQLAFYSGFSGIIGGFLGLTFLIYFPFLQVISIAGLVINPVINAWFLPIIAIGFFFITFFALVVSINSHFEINNNQKNKY